MGLVNLVPHVLSYYSIVSEEKTTKEKSNDFPKKLIKQLESFAFDGPSNFGLLMLS
jgi:hypothetical protein